MNRRIADAAYVGALLMALLLLVPVAFAAKGGGKGGGGEGTSSLSLAHPLVYDANGNDQPNWGDTVRFNVSTNATTEPHVDLTCYQSGALVYGATTGYYDSYPWPWTQNMTLSSQMWSGGAADCTARLYALDGRRTLTLATLAFRAEQ